MRNRSGDAPGMSLGCSALQQFAPQHLRHVSLSQLNFS
jgi:hypothetical protein